MANTIQIKRRTSGSGTLASLQEGELGVDFTDSNKLYVGTSGGNQLLNPSASTSYLPLAGGTLSGNLTVQGDTYVHNNKKLYVLDANGHKSLQITNHSSGSNSPYFWADPDDSASGTFMRFKVDATDVLDLTATGGTLNGSLTISDSNSSSDWRDLLLLQRNSADNFKITSNASNIQIGNMNGSGWLGFLAGNNIRFKILSGGDAELTGGLTLQESDGRSTLTLVGAKTADGNYGDILGSNNSGAGRAQISFRRISNDDATGILFYTEATGGSMSESMRIDSNGVTSYNDITINSGNATLRLNDTTSGSNFNIFSNGSELRMAQHNATFPGAYLNLTTGGNLGLGVTGASERLVVGGNIMLTSGAILTNHSSNNNYGFQIKSNDANQSALEFKDSGNNWLTTLYAARDTSSGTTYAGFLDAPWGNWDVRKTVNGALQIDQGSGLETVLTTTGGTLNGNRQ